MVESERVPPLDLEYFLGLETKTGVRVRDLEMRNGNHLVYKIMDPEMSAGEQGAPIVMPLEYRKRSTGNLSAIRAFVISVSAPFRRKHAKRELYWDMTDVFEGPDGVAIPKQKARWKVKTGVEMPSYIQAGMCVLYNSYNLAKVECIGLSEPLVIIREIDIDVVFDKSVEVELGDHVLRSKHANA